MWVGSQSGVVELYNSTTKLPMGHWSSGLQIIDMVYLPCAGCDNQQALMVLAKPSTIAIFTELGRQSSKLNDTIVPDHVINLEDDPICALLVPTDQLWVCTSNKQLNMFNVGNYNNPPIKCPNTYGAYCMATEKDYVLIASGSVLHKWSQQQPPSHESSLDCEATLMEKIPNYEGNQTTIVAKFIMHVCG